MKTDDMELVRGSGNVYRDFGYPDADVRQLKSILAAQILKILERDKLSVREAQGRTGIGAADFSRIRDNACSRTGMATSTRWPHRCSKRYSFVRCQDWIEFEAKSAAEHGLFAPERSEVLQQVICE